MIAKVERELCFRPGRQRANADGCTQARAGAYRPISAARLRVQTIELAHFGSDEEAVANDGRLTSGHRTRMSPGPLDLQPRNIFRLDSRLWLVAGIFQVASPAIPLR